MIEIRVNNGVIEYRTHLLMGVPFSEWGDWKQAQVVETFKGMAHKFTSFDEASTIPTFKFVVPPGVGKLAERRLAEQWAADAAEKVREQMQKDIDEVCGTPVKVVREQGKSRLLSPEYWAMLGSAAGDKSAWKRCADNWKRAYEKAVQTLRNVASQRDAAKVSNKKLIGERDEARALHRAQVRSVEQLKHELLQANQHLALIKRLPQHTQSVEQLVKENEALKQSYQGLQHMLEVKGQTIARLVDERDAALQKNMEWESKVNKLQEDNRKLTNANMIVRDQRNAARMEAIDAERKRVDAGAELKAAREERDRVRGENRSLHDTLFTLQQRRITERTLLPGADELMADIDAALKG